MPPRPVRETGATGIERPSLVVVHLVSRLCGLRQTGGEELYARKSHIRFWGA